MPRPRTGTLAWRKGIAFAQLTVTHKGKSVRDWYCLHTEDEATARRKMARLVADFAAGRGEAEALERASAPDTVATYAAALDTRLAEGDRDNLRVHVLPTLGPLALVDVRPVHVKNIRDRVIAMKARRGSKVLETTSRRGTVGKVLGAMRRLFSAAVEDELVEVNPAGDVRLPKQRGEAREIVKPRMILTDAEIVRYFECEDADLELRMLSLVARCEGGMRASDLRAWDWLHLDLADFASCTIPRAKTAKPEILDVPDELRPFLRAWWERAGKPIAGPVFPVRMGKRAGQIKSKKNAGYAKRLRRDLAKAGVFRLPPLLVPAVTQGTRTDKGKGPSVVRPTPNPRDPLYFETATSLPVDFHSFRRAFNTALARTNVNVQRAMRLAGHADAKTHMKYVGDAPEMRAIPVAALPQLPAVAIRCKSGRRTSNRRGSVVVADVDDDGANSGNHSLFGVFGPSTKPGVACSNHAGRAEDREDAADVSQRAVAEPAAPSALAVVEGASPLLVLPAPEATPRASLAAELAVHVAELLRAGDLQAARVASDALARLLGASG